MSFKTIDDNTNHSVTSKRSPDAARSTGEKSHKKPHKQAFIIKKDSEKDLNRRMKNYLNLP